MGAGVNLDRLRATLDAFAAIDPSPYGVIVSQDVWQRLLHLRRPGTRDIALLIGSPQGLQVRVVNELAPRTIIPCDADWTPMGGPRRAP